MKEDREVDQEAEDEIVEEEDMIHQALAPLHHQARLVQVQEAVPGDHDHVTIDDERIHLLLLLTGAVVHSNEKEDLCLKLPSTKIK